MHAAQNRLCKAFVLNAVYIVRSTLQRQVQHHLITLLLRVWTCTLESWLPRDRDLFHDWIAVQ